MSSAVNVGDKLVPFDPASLPVRISNLKHIARSPRHYLHALTADRDTRASRVGIGAHAIALGGDYVVYPGSDPGGEKNNVHRQGDAWKRFEALHAGRRILTIPEETDAQAIAQAIREQAGPLALLEGNHEVEIEWKWPTGRACVSHVDVMSKRHRRIVDLKTTSDTSPARFAWQSARMTYHAQAAFYRRAVETAHGWRAREVVLVAVESAAPHVITCYRFDEQALAEGDRAVALWMERLAVCEHARKWPGYCESIVELGVPTGRSGELVIEGEDAA